MTDSFKTSLAHWPALSQSVFVAHTEADYRRLVALLEAEGSVTLARVRDELGSSRKYVQALLEHFDAERVTLRRGDARVLRRRR